MSGYSEPNAIVRNEYFGGEAGGGATTEYAKFRRFQKLKLKKVHAVVTVAGTTTGHGFDVYHGTTSIGTIVLSTSTAGVSAASATLNREVASFEQMSVKSLADAAGKAHVIFEFHNQHDAVRTK